MLQFATHNKISTKIRNITEKARNESDNANFCCTCNVQFNSKMDKDFDLQWLGHKKKNCLGFISENAENIFLSGNVTSTTVKNTHSKTSNKRVIKPKNKLSIQKYIYIDENKKRKTVFAFVLFT